MKEVAILIIFVSFTSASPQILHGHKPVSVSTPNCHSVPEIKCVPRAVETPRKVCHQEYDEVVDTTITEHCKEVITTTCQQVILTSNIVGHESKVVATNVASTPLVTVEHGSPAPAPVSSAVLSHYVEHGTPTPTQLSNKVLPVPSQYVEHESIAPAPAALPPVLTQENKHQLLKRNAEAIHDVHYGPVIVPKSLEASPNSDITEPVCQTHPVKTCENVPTDVPRYHF